MTRGHRMWGAAVGLLVALAVSVASPVAAVGPVVGPERRFADPVFVPSPGSQVAPGVAFDGANFLAVWEDVQTSGGRSTSRLRGARLTPSRQLVDPVGFDIATPSSGFSVADPQVSYDGQTYLVVWLETRTTDVNGVTVEEATLKGVPVSPGGALLGAPVRIDQGGLGQAGSCCFEEVIFSVASDGSAWTVVYQDFNEDAIVARRVAPIGQPVGSAVTIGDGEFNSQPAIAPLGTGSLVVWVHGAEGGSQVLGVRLDSAGAILDTTPLILADVDPDAPHRYRPSVAVARVAVLVVWSEQEGFLGPHRLMGTRVGPKGGIPNPGGLPLTPAVESEVRATVTSDATGWFVAYDQGDDTGEDVFGFRVDPFGQRTGPILAFGSGPGPHSSPAVAFGGDQYLVLWQQRDDRLGVRGARVTRSGTVLDVPGFVVTRSRTSQRRPAVAFDGTNHLVVWVQEALQPNGDHTLRASRVRPDGTRLDGPGIVIADGVIGSPAVSYDGQNYVIAWLRSPDVGPVGEIVAVRVSRAGQVLDAEPTIVTREAEATFEESTTIASDPVTHTSFVAYGSPQEGRERLRGVRLSGAGSVIDQSPIEISPRPTYSVDVSYNGQAFVIAWATDSSTGGGASVRAIRVTPGGAIPDPVGTVIGEGHGQHRRPEIASIGSTSMIVWIWYAPFPALYAARVSANGTRLDEPQLITDDPLEWDIAANGSYLVTTSTTSPDELVGIRFGTNGKAQGQPTRIATGPILDAPAVTRAKSDDFAITYARPVTSIEAAGYIRAFSPK